MKKLDWHLQAQQGDTWLGNVKDSGTSDSKWPPHMINLHRRASLHFHGCHNEGICNEAKKWNIFPPQAQLFSSLIFIVVFFRPKYLTGESHPVSVKDLFLLNCFSESVSCRPHSSLGFYREFPQERTLPHQLWIKIKFPGTCCNWYGREGQLLSASSLTDFPLCFVPASCRICIP